MAETTEEGNCLSGLLKTIYRILPRRAKKDCQYCYESKANKAFTAGKLVPLSCQSHLRDVCRTCVQSSLRTQLENRPLLEVGCPQCKLSWESRYLRALLGHRDRKRFQKLDLIAQGRSFVPVPEQMPEKPTMDLMLDQGARLCPWCRFPFVKEGGCDHISCACSILAIPVIC